MTIDDIIARSRLRENNLWTPFSHCFVGTDDERRTVLFGLYSRGFENGFIYLVEISTEQLLQVVAQYDSNMAALDADQQIAVLDIASKRYLDTLEQQIHDQKMIVQQSKIDADDLEFDAKMTALEADGKALETLQEKLVQTQTKVVAEISILEARFQEEEVAQSYVEVEITEKEISAKRIEFRVIQAGIKGLEIQLDIQNTAIQNIEYGVDKHNIQHQVDLIPEEQRELETAEVDADAKIKNIDTDYSLLDAEILEIQNKTANTQIDTVAKEVDTQLLEVDIVKALVDTKMVDVEITQLNTKTAMEEAKKTGLETETALVAVQLAQLQVDTDKIAVQLAEIDVDMAMLDIKMLRTELLKLDKQIIQVREDNLIYEIPLREAAQLALISKQIEVLQAKITEAQQYKILEASMQLSRKDKKNAEHDYRMAIAILNEELSVTRSDIKILGLSKDADIADEQQDYQEDEDVENVKISASQISAALVSYNAAIDAAKTMATANIINTLSHQIGTS
jgi:hypothetical protein